MADAKGTGKAAGKVELIQTLPEVFAAKDRAMKAIDEKKGFHTEEDEQNWFVAAEDALEDVRRVRELLTAAIAIASDGSEGIEGVTSYAAVLPDVVLGR